MASETTEVKAVKSNLVCYAVRLGPGEEIKSRLLEVVTANNLRAPFVISCVGSVQKATLRLAHATAEDRNHKYWITLKPTGIKSKKYIPEKFFVKVIVKLEEKYEIVSLVGTLADGGHLHASLADKKGGVVGGHVMGDMVVFTTAELVIGECPQAVFSREMDTRTGFTELVVTPIQV